MCVLNPITAVSAVVSLVSTAVVGIKNTIVANKQQKIAEKQNILKAKIAERNAAYERQEGIEDARQKRLKSIQNIGSYKASVAAGNIMTTSESAINLFDDEKLSGELDALKLLNSSERRAESYLNSAQSYYNNAEYLKYKRKQSWIDSGISFGLSAGNTILNLAT